MENPHFSPSGITPDHLLMDNRSDVVRQGWLPEWYGAKNSGRLTAIKACSDARLGLAYFAGPTIAKATSIAAGASIKPFQYLLNHKGVGQAVVLGHFNCGGVGAAGDLSHISSRLVSQFIRKNVKDDVVIQTLENAERASLTTNKPVLAAVMDHKTGKIMPFAQFIKGKLYSTSIDTEAVKTGRTRYAYSNLPELSNDALLDSFHGLMNWNMEYVGRFERMQSLQQGQEVQDPRLALITTSIIPSALRYPTFYSPNSIFTVGLAYEKWGADQSINIQGINVREAMQQIEYPLGNAVEAEKKGKPDFFSTRTLLIETPNLKESCKIAAQVVQEGFSHEWIRIGGQILVAEIKSGATTHVEKYSL